MAEPKFKGGIAVEPHEVPASIRAGLSIKTTPAGKAGYLEHHYGKGNVVPMGGDYWVHKDGRMVPVDPGGITDIVGDIADLTGPAIEVTPAVATGLVTGASPVGAAAGAAAGNVARQAVSEMLPGEEDYTVMGIPQLGRVLAPAGVAVTAGVAQKGINVGAALFDKYVRPSNLLAQYMRKISETPAAKQGRIAADESGIPLSIGEETGARGVRMVEGVLRQYVGTADRMQRAATKQMRSVLTSLDDILSKLDPTRPGTATVGNRLTAAYRKATDEAVKVRRNNARVLFGAVDDAADGEKVLPTDSLIAKIDEMIDEFDAAGGGDATAALVNRLKTVKAQLFPEDAAAPNMITAKHANRLLSIYSKAATGKGQLFLDIDRAQQRYVASQFLEGMQGVLDDAVNILGDEAGAAAVALRAARDQYRRDSGLIGELAETVMGRLLNRAAEPAPEEIVKQIAKMAPSEMKVVLPILHQFGPRAISGLRHEIISTALEKAQTPAAGALDVMIDPSAVVQRAFSPAKFLSALPKEETLRGLFHGRELVQIRYAARALMRMADKAGMAGSQTGPWQAVMKIFTEPAHQAAGLIAARKASKVLLDPGGREALMALNKATKVDTKVVTAALATLTGILAAEEASPAIYPQPSAPGARRFGGG